MSGTSDVLAALGLTEDATLDAAREHRPPSRRRHARTPTETSIRTACANLILQLGGKPLVKHQTLHGEKGTPDLLNCVPTKWGIGRCVVIEVKKLDADPPDPAQIGRLREWQSKGALAGWVRSVEHLREILDHLDDPEWRNDFAAPGDGRAAA